MKPLGHAPGPGAANDRVRDAGTPDVSVVVPMLDEEDNVGPLFDELREVLDATSLVWEAIFIDDGSKDATVERLVAAIGNDPRIRIIRLSRRFGQTAALAAGFRAATGRAIVPMDADMQNDPRDIEALVLGLDADPGYDVVSGWRKDRKDKLWTRRLPSTVANRLIARLTWTPIHDFGCTIKAYRATTLRHVALYGEMHRFLPAICNWNGARITERIVNHRPRIHGRTKYDLRRTVKVMLDLLTVKFLGDYLTKPLYAFGKISAVSLVLALTVLGVAGLQKFGYLYPGDDGLNLNRNVLVLGGMMLMLMSFMMLMLGVLSELLVRIYHESQGMPPYRVLGEFRAGIDDPAVLDRPVVIQRAGPAPVGSVRPPSSAPRDAGDDRASVESRAESTAEGGHGPDAAAH